MLSLHNLIRYNSTFKDHQKGGLLEFIKPSPAALMAMVNMCCATCFIALLPEEPARATSFNIGYIASNLSVAYVKHKLQFSQTPTLQ